MYNIQTKKNKRTKGQTMIRKTLHRKLAMEQYEPYKNLGWTPQGQAVPVPRVAPVLLLLLQTRW